MRCSLVRGTRRRRRKVSIPLASGPTYSRSHLQPVPLTAGPTYSRSHLQPVPLAAGPSVPLAVDFTPGNVGSAVRTISRKWDRPYGGWLQVGFMGDAGIGFGLGFAVTTDGVRPSAPLHAQTHTRMSKSACNCARMRRRSCRARKHARACLRARTRTHARALAHERSRSRAHAIRCCC